MPTVTKQTQNTAQVSFQWGEEKKEEQKSEKGGATSC